MEVLNNMEDLTLVIITTSIGLVVGFFSNYTIAKFNARNELKKSIAVKRAEQYLGLWKLCGIDLGTQKKRNERYKKLKQWYADGGGLFLSFKATDRFVGAVNVLEGSMNDKLDEEKLTKLKEDLSWIRTEMKYEVGAYSRWGVNKKLPNIKIREEEEEAEAKEKEEPVQEKSSA